MPTPSHTITCTQNKVIAHDVHEIRFTKPEGFSFRAGQFVLLDVPLVEDLEDIQTRAYSIASAPNEEDILFVIKLVKGGRTSTWIEKLLKEGTDVRIQGPLGVFTLNAENPKDYLLVCTGAGIAPYRSQIVAILAEGEARPIDLVFCVSKTEDLFWVDEFNTLAEQYDNFRFHVTLSRPTDDWEGHRGRLQAVIPQLFPDLSNKQLYACGNPNMTIEMKKYTLEEWGMPKEDVHLEGYI